MDDRLKNQVLSDQERLFCYFMASLCNPGEAALKAGFPMEEAIPAAAALLRKAGVHKEINRLQRMDTPRRTADMALAGLRRLAFGSAGDAAALTFLDEAADRETISAMDLFCVSELKRPKGGGVEVRFFDRIKALEALLQWSMKPGAEPKKNSLLGALEKSAAALNEGGGNGSL